MIGNIQYDFDKAASVQSGYLPDIDETLNTKKGICFDYAALMTAMLRVQRIPTKLVVGYAGELYHAWISVYLDGVGWIDNIIYFDGKDWVRMDLRLPLQEAAPRNMWETAAIITTFIIIDP